MTKQTDNNVVTTLRSMIDAIHKALDELEHGAAIKTLNHLGYTYHGGEQWKPPIDQPVQQQAQSEWVSLTEEEIDFTLFSFDRDSSLNDVARSIEAKLKEKNHGA